MLIRLTGRPGASLLLALAAASLPAVPAWAQDAVASDMLATLPTVPPLVRSGPLSFAPLVRRVVPAVVNIAVTQDVEDEGGNDSGRIKVPPALRGTPFEKQYRDRMRKRREQMLGAGSGFVIDPAGIIVTNNHVVGNADKITVSFSDGTELPARLLGTDELTDIAVIAVKPAKPLAWVSWGDSRHVEVGDWIMAAGNPFGLGSSVTAGIVSARGRDIGAGPFDDFLQLDAPINPGNSGGPTFNMSGQVVALNTAIVSPTGGSVGIGFGIPSEIVAPIVAQLREKGHIDRGWLGVTLEERPDQGPGVTIVAIDRSGPAMRAGLKAGDTVDTVNGDKVDSARSLIRAIAAAAPGSSIRLSVVRAGHSFEVPMMVGRRPAEDAG
ncbi:S1C family serine protease [Lichenicoccus roseus]|uniref:PDZ domain-containing protein n=1 Tax=Lichenicoccus roseus TaxID=2683649 RepID=A0A5R9J5N6_9PROT|nr:trypsin-like peptidase domain-containing protein [Lichenicoccus roseus]TLU72935.1 PDZ domain-containing protein [Lichenicoccus roseus]